MASRICKNAAFLCRFGIISVSLKTCTAIVSDKRAVFWNVYGLPSPVLSPRTEVCVVYGNFPCGTDSFLTFNKIDLCSENAFFLFYSHRAVWPFRFPRNRRKRLLPFRSHRSMLAAHGSIGSLPSADRCRSVSFTTGNLPANF